MSDSPSKPGVVTRPSRSPAKGEEKKEPKRPATASSDSDRSQRVVAKPRAITRPKKTEPQPSATVPEQGSTPLSKAAVKTATPSKPPGQVSTTSPGKLTGSAPGPTKPSLSKNREQTTEAPSSDSLKASMALVANAKAEREKANSRYYKGTSKASNAWSRFAIRLGGILFRPTAFWEHAREEDVRISELVTPHLLFLVGVCAIGDFVGAMLQDVEFAKALGSSITNFVSWFALVWVFAIVSGTVASTRGGRLSANDSMAFSVFGLTPLFAVGGIAAIPVPYVAQAAEVLAMPYAFYVLALGVVPMLRIPVERAPAVVGQLCGTVVVLWTVMRTLLLRLVGAG